MNTPMSFPSQKAERVHCVKGWKSVHICVN